MFEYMSEGIEKLRYIYCFRIICEKLGECTPGIVVLRDGRPACQPGSLLV